MIKTYGSYELTSARSPLERTLSNL